MIKNSKPSILSLIASQRPEMARYLLLGDRGSVTVKGIFINRFGRQTGAEISTTVPHADTVNDPVHLSPQIPSDAVGFVGYASGGLRLGLFDGDDGSVASESDFKANYELYPYLSATTVLCFGAVEPF